MENTNHVWPGWETVRLIGRGSFGAVYEIQREVGEHTSRAALKVIRIPQKEEEIAELRAEGYDNHSLRMYYADSLRQIENEYALLAELKGHANVVYCDDIRSEPHPDGFGWNVYLKMELLTPLKEWLNDQDPAKQAIRLGRDICNALVFCRKYHVVHRDIKPENIFIARDGNFKLGDFGIAKTMEGTSGGTVTGTFEYMSPEVYHNRPYNDSADIYSLGLVMYWMLNERSGPFLTIGKKPTPTEIKAARSSRFDGEPIPMPKNGSAELKRIVLKACAFDPQDRFGSAREMLDALNALLYAPAADAPREEGTIGPWLGKKKKSGPPRDEERTDHDETAELTVGPGQKMASANEEESTVGPRFKGKEAHPQPRQKTARPWIRWAALALAAVLLLLLLPRSCGEAAPGETEPVETIQETIQETNPETTIPAGSTVPEETLPVQLEFSEWADTLPEYVTAANYVIEDQTLYSTQVLEKTTSTETDTMEGWTLTQTISNLGEYGPWSEWSREKVSESETRNVRTEVRYRYKTRETTTSSEPTRSGWELYDTTYSWGNYGGWSDWSTTEASSSESREVQTKTQYRYRDRETKTSYQEALSGYTLTGSSWEKESSGTIKYAPSFPGGFSTSHSLYNEYNHTPKSASESNTARTVIDSDSHYGYLYFHWCRGTYSQGPINRKCRDYRSGEFTAFHAFFSTTAPSSLTPSADGDGSYRYDNGSCCKDTYWYYTTRVNKQTYTSYKKLFSYERWSDWSAWSDNAVSASSTRKIETRILYRSRSRAQIPTYHFQRWSDWSAWSTKAVSKNDDRKVETAAYYQYQDKVTEKTYCFQRWTDWSDYSTEPAVESEEQKVQTKKQYRYRSKTEAELRNPYADVEEEAAYFDAVMWVSDQGIMNGTSGTTFAPDGTMTRGQMVTILWRAAGKPAPTAAECPFKDVTADSPFFDAVLWATENKIAGGESQDTFGVDAVCSRGQAITFLYRAAGEPDVVLSQEPFADVAEGDFFYDAVLWAYANNVSSGISTTEFGVTAACTRMQVAVMLYRAFAGA